MSVKRTTQESGIKGIYARIKDFIDQHHTTRKFLLQGLIAVMGVAISMQVEVIAAVPINQAQVIVLMFALLNATHNWLKHNIAK